MVEFSDFIASYGQDVGISDLKLNEQGVCSLNFDSKVNVDIVFKQDQDQCIFASNLGEIPTDNLENFFRELLKANVFGISTAGTTIGIDEGTNMVVLSFTFITQSFTFDLFKTVLDNSVSLVDEWTQKVENLKTSHSNGVTSSSSDVQSASEYGNFISA